MASGLMCILQTKSCKGEFFSNEIFLKSWIPSLFPPSLAKVPHMEDDGVEVARITQPLPVAGGQAIVGSMGAVR